jgi:molybdopterin converting factor subunit 1
MNETRRMNRVKILLFATLKDRVGARSLDLDLPLSSRVADLKEVLVKTYPQLAPASGSMMVAVNREYAGDEQVIPPQAEIAIFPPVSGG